MEDYFKQIPKNVLDYFHVLSKEIPDFIYEYIKAPEMQRLRGIGMTCGANFSKLFPNIMFYSRLEHSIGVALIVWNFTKDKKQTLAGLFHDIANPAFSHCIDFLNGDYETQESTEELTSKIISESTYIMNLLKRDNIKLEEVDDYKIYPIADNDTPMISADRLEYSFSNGFSLEDIWEEGEIQKIYSDLTILKNESGQIELGFQNFDIAEEFIDKIKILWKDFVTNRFVMQSIVEIAKQLNEKGLLKIEDFYKLSEAEIIEIARKSNIEKVQNLVEKIGQATNLYESDEEVKDRYCVKVPAKYRYIDPLVNTSKGVVRLTKISNIAMKAKEDLFKIDFSKYLYSNFNI